MSSEEEQIQQRRANLTKLGELGVNSYPHRFERSATITDLVRAHGEKTGPQLEEQRVDTITSGRILGIRSFGKANFLVLSDGRSRIQVYIKKDSLQPHDFELFRLLDFGDVVGVEGHLFRTRTNELTIWASRLEFLAKCHVPMPEKWHGLTDVEIRYRQRYLDLIVNPEAREVFQVRSKILSALREFLDERGYLEVETPMMQPIAGGAMARPFRTHHNALDVDLYLRIAPELYLKRLVVGGLERVYEINRVFRNEGISTRHNPEFTMLEFYQAYSDYQDLMKLTEEMIAFVAMSAVGKDEVEYDGDTIALRRAIRARIPAGSCCGRLRPGSQVSRLPLPTFATAKRRGSWPRAWASRSTLEAAREKRPWRSSRRWSRNRSSSRPSSTTFQPKCRRCRNNGRTILIPWSGSSSTSARWRWPTHSASSTILSSSGSASSTSSQSGQRAIRKRTPWTKTTSERSSTGCRRRPAKG